MKILRQALCAVMLVVPALAWGGTLTAYEALISVGRLKGDAFLDNLIEMRASEGTPQPEQWTLLFRDPDARGGVREFTVNSQGVQSERTPVRTDDALLVAETMPHATLKMDSSGAFVEANRLASDARAGFDTATYRLHSLNGTPVWTLSLLDAGRREVGVMAVSAKDGSVVKPWTAAPDGANSPTDSRQLSERWAEGGGLVGHVTRWGERAWSTTTNTVVGTQRSVEKFFIGDTNASPAASTTEGTQPDD